MLQFRNQKIDNRRIIGAELIHKFLTWIYASYTVHPYMKILTGGAISFGWALIHWRYLKDIFKSESYTGDEVDLISA